MTSINFELGRGKIQNRKKYIIELNPNISKSENYSNYLLDVLII